ncbi:MAG TPA: S9 family peptidase [Candidatus Polarisedimenticolaceae bacterium]|nr:S9 family peptidase [Candidatus Polarisedimenticolaceae bacterium]
MSKTFRGLTVIAAATVLLAGCGGGGTEQPENPWTAENTPLIEREVLFGNPERASVQISDDGSKIAWLAPVDDVLNVWVADADDPTAGSPVTNDTDRGIRIYFWAPTNQHVVYVQDEGGDEDWQVYLTDVATRETRNLTPIDGVQARVAAVHHDFPNEIIVALNDRDPRHHDLYRVNLTTGERTLIEKNEDGFIEYTIDDDFNVRLATKVTQDGGAEVFKRSLTGKWESYATIPSDDVLTTKPLGFDASGNVLYWIDSRGRDTAALLEVDLSSNASQVLGTSDKADVSDVMIHPTTSEVEAVAYTYDRKNWDVLDEAVAKDMEFLRTVTDGETEVQDRTLDDRTWIVSYELDDGPVQYYLYDRDAGKADYLFSNRPALEELPLAEMHPVVIAARDGVQLVSYYTLPVWSDSTGDGIPEQPLPMALVVHGGPWARDDWGYNSLHQWLANRGYAVLSVNFRGSTGLGKAHVNAGNLEWAGKMHDDLIDAVDWAVERGIAQRDKVAIMGGSYGGYATLVGLTFTPDVFACGVDIVGPSNLNTLIESIPPYWEPMIELFAARVGDSRTETGRTLLEERSPLRHADRIERPLLIGQGANDPRVKQAEADQIVAAMQTKEIPVTYVLYPDEGHGFARPENRLSFFAVSEAFLAGHLGGRIEPVGDDFADSSIQVVEGAELIAGLTEALGAQPEMAD